MITNARRIALLFALLSVPLVSHAQGPTFSQWFDQRVRDLKLTDANSKVAEKQKETPAGATGSTSLVDQSASSDFVSLALGLIPIRRDTGGGNSNKPTLTTMTVSVYSLAAWGSGKDLTDPTFYGVHTDLRRLYFTLGTAESKKDDDDTDRPAVVIGAKYLIMNQRDIYAARNQGLISGVQSAVTRAGAVEAQLKMRIQRAIFQSAGRGQDEAAFLGRFSDVEFPRLLQSLNAETLKQVDQMIQAELPAFVELQAAVADAYDQIHKGRQLALSGSANLRPDLGNDDYRLELIYDHGLNKNVTWTVNASGDYRDRKEKEALRGGRVATEFLGTLSRSDDKLWARSSATLSFSGEARWQSKVRPIYTFQARLSIPITTGIDLPIVYRYANRTLSTNSADPEARLGLSVDVGRLTELLR